MDKIKWKTVTYTIVELKPVGGVVIQRDVLEKYKAEHLDEEVKTFAGFKCNQQDKTVSLRIGIADPTIAADSGTVAKIILNEKVGENLCLCGACADNIKLQEKYDALEKEKETLHEGYDRVVTGAHEDDKEFHELKIKYDALYIVHEELKVELEQTRIALFADEDSADLAEAEKAIVEGGGISLDKAAIELGEDALQINKEPVTDTEGGEDE